MALLRYLFSAFIYWIVVFAVLRILFIFVNVLELFPFQSLTNALALDSSMASYLLLGSFFIGIAKCWYSKDYALFEAWYMRILLVIVVIVSLSNMFLYRDWKTLINQRAVDYLKTPSGLLNSITFMQGVQAVLAIISLFFLFEKIRSYFVRFHVGKVSSSKKSLLYSVPFSICLLIIGVRGGIGVMPINESHVYFSEKIVENHAAVNPLWHFIHTLIEHRVVENPYVFMDEKTALDVVPNIEESNSSERIGYGDSSLIQPNIVLIGMESMSTQFLESYGGYRGLTPYLDAIANLPKTMRLSQCYSSGYRTDQGFVSLLSGYPALPNQSVILLEDKVRDLPSLPADLKVNGYFSSFFYGGTLTFANLGVYVHEMGFDQVTAQKDFPISAITQRWGVDDQGFLATVAESIASQKEPFFTFAMTLGQHSPFDVPGYDAAAGEDERFRYAVRYADAAIGGFWKAMQKLPSFERTIFIFVADHGHPGVQHYWNHQPEARHVPVLIVGNPLQQKEAQVSDYICNHHDLGALIRAYTKVIPLGTALPFFQKNLHAGVYERPIEPGFAYYSNEDGMGWISDYGKGYYNFTESKWTFFEDAIMPEAEQVAAKAYLQLLYTDYLRLGAE